MHGEESVLKEFDGELLAGRSERVYAMDETH